MTKSYISGTFVFWTIRRKQYYWVVVVNMKINITLKCTCPPLDVFEQYELQNMTDRIFIFFVLEKTAILWG